MTAYYLSETDRKHLAEMHRWSQIWQRREGAGPRQDFESEATRPLTFAKVVDNDIEAAEDDDHPSFGFVRLETLLPDDPAGKKITDDERVIAFVSEDEEVTRRVYNLSTSLSYEIDVRVALLQIANGHWIVRPLVDRKIGFLSSSLEAASSPKAAWSSQPSSTVRIFTEDSNGTMTDTGETETVHSKRDVSFATDTFVEITFKRNRWQLTDANCEPTEPTP